MYPGRAEQQKARLAEAVVKDVTAITNVGDDAVSVTIEEVKPDDWFEKVYKPDIVNGSGKLYKKPGYDALRLKRKGPADFLAEEWDLQWIEQASRNLRAEKVLYLL